MEREGKQESFGAAAVAIASAAPDDDDSPPHSVFDKESILLAPCCSFPAHKLLVESCGQISCGIKFL